MPSLALALRMIDRVRTEQKSVTRAAEGQKMKYIQCVPINLTIFISYHNGCVYVHIKICGFVRKRECVREFVYLEKGVCMQTSVRVYVLVYVFVCCENSVHQTSRVYSV